MDENCASTPKDEQAAEEIVNRPIKIEKVFNSEKENSVEKDEASMDKSNEAYEDQHNANGLGECRTKADEFFVSDVLLNYPYVNKLWNESSTRLFLNMYKELKGKYDKGESYLKHRQRFAVIAMNLRKYGFDYTAVQVENRFKSLKRSYQKKVTQEDVPNKQGKFRPSHPSSQYHLYADDMHEIFGECLNEMREAAANPTCLELRTNSKETRGRAKKRKPVEIAMEEQPPTDDEYSESRSEDFRHGSPSFIQQLRKKIPETITCTTDDCRFSEARESTPPFHFPDPSEAHVGDAVEELRLIREDYNTWQKIREDGKNRRHQEKMAMYSQLIQAMTSRK